MEGFHRAVDFVARERKYIAFLEAPPLDSTREFVMNNIAMGYPQFVAVAGGEVVGWCDLIPKSRPIHAHCGVLGMALLPPFRGRGHGTACAWKPSRCGFLGSLALSTAATAATWRTRMNVPLASG